MDKHELMENLYKPFELHEHEIRIGSTKNKAQWFIYVRREAITERLDRLFPLDWSDEIIRIEQKQNFATAIMRLTISGISRENNGSNSGNDENSEKGAVTDAFKRVASSFGLGLYLQSTPQLWTAGGFVTKSNDGKWRTDYKEQNKQEKEAFGKFSNWYRQQFGGGNGNNQNNNGKQAQPQPQEAQHAEWTPEDKANFSMALSKRFPNTHTSIMLTSMKKKSLSELGTIAQAANAAIEWSYSNEQPFIADVVRYVSDGKNSFMVFRADDDPDSKHIAVRAYGRSTTVKSWLGDYAYDALEFGTIHETPNEWIPLKRSLTIFYDAKQKEDGSTYYVANGIGHGIEDPDEVDF